MFVPIKLNQPSAVNMLLPGSNISVTENQKDRGTSDTLKGQRHIFFCTTKIEKLYRNQTQGAILKYYGLYFTFYSHSIDKQRKN